MPIFKKPDEKSYKLQRGFFSRAKYEAWLMETGGEPAVLLSRLSERWPYEMDGTDEMTVQEEKDEEPAIFIYRIGASRLERIRIMMEWIEWRDN
jgi:hypothetical protein